MKSYPRSPSITSEESAADRAQEVLHDERQSLLSKVRTVVHFPVLPKESKKLRTALVLMKSFVGTGVLFLPRAFINGGYLFSSVVMVAVAAVTLKCMFLLLECKSEVGGSFENIGNASYGYSGKIAVKFSVFLSQLGFCVCYVIFVARNLSDFLTSLGWKPSLLFLIFIQILVYVPLVCIRKIQYLAWPSFFATVFCFIGLAYAFAVSVQTISLSGAQPVKLFDAQHFALFLGTAVYSFEGIGTLLHIQSSTRDKASFNTLLTTTLAIVCVVVVVVSVTCCFAFGDGTQTVVLLNLKPSPMTVAVQIMYCIAVAISFPLQAFPLVRLLEGDFFLQKETTPLASDNHLPRIVTTATFWQENVFRFALVCFITSIAVLGADKFDVFVSLVGSIACVPLAFIYPALFHFKLLARSTLSMVVDLALLSLGVFLVCFCGIVSFWSFRNPVV